MIENLNQIDEIKNINENNNIIEIKIFKKDIKVICKTLKEESKPSQLLLCEVSSNS